MLTVAGIVNAFGVTFFLVLLNLPLFLYGYRRMGQSFTLRSVYAVAVYSLVAWLITEVSDVLGKDG